MSIITPYVNSKGEEFTQLFQHFPILSNLYTPFEKTYDTIPGIEFCFNNPVIPVALVCCYMAFCYFGQKYMSTREAFDLRMPLAYWNLLLSTFSFIGMARTVPHLLHNLSTNSLENNLCSNAQVTFGGGASGFWVQMFIFSKIPELFDTVFIVLRKRPLIFLHWYHHVTVLLFCWHSYATEASTGLFFVAMNYSVHAIMYGYYCLSALKMRPKWLPPQIITVSQITQMIIGTSLCVFSGVLLRRGGDCQVKKRNVLAGGLMYGSYLYLFAEFAVKRFILAPPKKVKKLE